MSRSTFGDDTLIPGAVAARGVRGSLGRGARVLRAGEWIAYAITCTLVALLVWMLSAWLLLDADDHLTLLISTIALRGIGIAAAAGAWGVALQRCLELNDEVMLQHGLVPRRPLRDARGRQVALLLLLATAGLWVLLRMYG